jgi:ABC-type phosphate transport system permease subunit
LEKKGTSKRGKQGKKMELSICICFAFILLFRFTFLLLFFLLLAWKKGKTHANRKKQNKCTKKHANGQFHCFTLFCLSLFFPFFASYFAFVFFGFC